MTEETTIQLPEQLDPRFNAGHTDEFAKLLWGKRVSLIGGAPNVDKRAFTADIVVQLQGHWARPDRNERADIVYFQNYVGSFAELGYKIDDFSAISELKDLKFVQIHLSDDMNWWKLAEACEKKTIPWAYYGVNPEIPNVFRWETFWPWQFTKRYGAIPFTGHLALFHLLMHGPLRIFVTGMDCYASYTSNGLPPFSVGLHKMLPHIQFLRDALREDDRLIVDDTITNLVNKLPKFYEKPEALDVFPSGIDSLPTKNTRGAR